MSVHLVWYWKKYRDRCLLIAAIVFSVILLTVSEKPPFISLRGSFSEWMGPIQGKISWLPRIQFIRQENQRLMTEVGKRSFQMDQVQEVVQENDRFRKLLDFQERSQYDFIPARVIGMGSSGLPGSVHLNVGSEDGCQKNMVLVTDQGVVGKLLTVNRSTSIGQIMTDPNFRISARLQRSRVLGIVRWLYGNVCALEGVHQRGDVQIGDVVMTSGYSEIYPPGLPVGKVYWISHQEDDLFQEIRLQLEVDMYALEEVLVLKNMDSVDPGK